MGHHIWIWFIVIPFLITIQGCDSGSDSSTETDGWKLAEYEDTDVIPNTGIYEFSATGCFEVIDDPDSSNRLLFYASDCFNYRRMEIINGTFYGTWGDIDGTHCPEDSFGISGHFNTPHSAVGTIKYAVECEVFESLEFTATN
jgi:hypothetical protein